MMKYQLILCVCVCIIQSKFSFSYAELQNEWNCDVKVNDSISLIMSSDSDVPFNISISVNGDPSKSIGIAWFTNPHIEEGEVLYIKKGDSWDNALSIQGSCTKNELNYLSSTNSEVITQTGYSPYTKREYSCYKAKLPDLESDTEYNFIIKNKNASSHIGSFKTVNPDKEFSFIYLTDFQVHNKFSFDLTEKTIRNSVANNPDASFILVNGDFIESFENNYAEWEWEHFFLRMRDIMMNNIFVPVIGNHDANPSNNFSLHFNTDDSFNDNANVKTRMPGLNYYFTINDCLFFVLSYEEYKKEGYFEELKKWMDSVLKIESDKKWRIALFHRCMFTGAEHQHEPSQLIIRENMCEWFDLNKIDLAIQGHDHVYQVIGPVSNKDYKQLDYLISNLDYTPDEIDFSNMKGRKNGNFNLNEGTLYFVNNSAGYKRYIPLTEEQMIKKKYYHKVDDYWSLFSGRFGQNHKSSYSNINVNKDGIQISTYSLDNDKVNDNNEELFDKINLIKNDDLATPIISIKPNDYFIVENKILTFKNIDNKGIKVWIYDYVGREILSSSNSVIDISGFSNCYLHIRFSINGKIHNYPLIVR